MIRIAICDDNEKDRFALYRWLEGYVIKRKERLRKEQSYEIKMFESGNQLLVSEYPADILLLDIVLTENQRDGIQIGAEFRRRSLNAIIIFMTKLPDEIWAAVNQVHAFGYLIKPINDKDANRLLEDALKILGQDAEDDILTFLSEDNAIIELNAEDIYYFEYDNRRIRIVTEKETYVCVKEKIGDLATRMEKYAFVMSHQSFVVNLYKVEKMDSKTLLMKNGDQVCLAQKRASFFRKQLRKAVKK